MKRAREYVEDARFARFMGDYRAAARYLAKAGELRRSAYYVYR